ncbi:MAG: MHYT domain-containing protein [Xanthobacteraceae bacterium]|nr:MHYT domain-containing protein [Xanthobacteraceae bacterium]
MGELIVFLDGPAPGYELKAVYSPGLVALSYIVASIAAFTALDFAGRMMENRGDRTAAYSWLVGGACAMGAGIWCMHFVAMLAFRLPLPVRYDLPITLLSMLFAIIISGFALMVVNHRDVSRTRLLVGGVIMGLGICTMHYTGMIAMHMDAAILYRREWFLLSIVNAIVCSTIALWLVSFLGGTTQRARTRTRYNVMAAMMMGVAICGTHYTAMYATVCVSTGGQTQPVADIDPTLLGTMIGGVTIAIMGAALAVSLWTISRRLERQNLLLTDEIAERRRAEALAARDVTERKQAETQLLESEARMTAILAAAVDAIIIIDASGTIESLNTAAEKLFGYTVLDLVGQNVKMLMPAPYKAEHDGYLHNYTTTGVKKIIGIGREVVGLRKNGETFPSAVPAVQSARKRGRHRGRHRHRPDGEQAAG